MPTLTIEPANPFDLTDDDAQELRDLLVAADQETEVRIARRREEGYGVSAEEILRVFVEHPELAAPTVATIKALFSWLKKRLARDGRKRTVIIYGPDGDPLKAYEVDDASAEPRDVAPKDEPRLPPAAD